MTCAAPAGGGDRGTIEVASDWAYLYTTNTDGTTTKFDCKQYINKGHVSVGQGAVLEVVSMEAISCYQSGSEEAVTRISNGATLKVNKYVLISNSSLETVYVPSNMSTTSTIDTKGLTILVVGGAQFATVEINSHAATYVYTTLHVTGEVDFNGGTLKLAVNRARQEITPPTPADGIPVGHEEHRPGRRDSATVRDAVAGARRAATPPVGGL